jgi:hypothetical protein
MSLLPDRIYEINRKHKHPEGLVKDRAYSWISARIGISAAGAGNSRTSGRVTLATLRICFSGQR